MRQPKIVAAPGGDAVHAPVATRTFLDRVFSWLPERHRRVFALAAVMVVALSLPEILNDDANVDSLSNALAFAALALGLNIVVGMAGLLDLGFAAFFAIGAYAYGILSSYQLAPHWTSFWQPLANMGLVERLAQGGMDLVHFTVPFWIMLPGSAIIAACFGMLFGAPTLRLKGDYLAIVTLGFGEIVPIVVRNWTGLTNGAAGLNGIQAPSFFGKSFGIEATPYYFVALALVALLVFVSVRLRDSRIGRAWMAIREDEIAAEAMGVDLTKFKLLAFATGAGFAGAVGTFYVAKLQTATPEMFGYPVSVMVLVMVVLGGLGSVWGVLVGAIFLQLLQTWFLGSATGWLNVLGVKASIPFLEHIDLTRATELIFGVVLVLIMLFRREGLIPATRRQARVDPGDKSAGLEESTLFDATHVADHQRAAYPLDISGLTMKFGGLIALDNVDITVPAGSVVAIIGPNGSGKSTLFNTITGLLRPTSGSISFGGERIDGLKPNKILERGVARTFQNIRLFNNLTVLENVMVGQHSRLEIGPLRAVLRLPSTRKKEAAAALDAAGLVEVFGSRLTPQLKQTVEHLSYANRRRIEIARALASRPGILLLDEPTAGMNPAESLELAGQIKSLHAMGVTVLMIEHKLDVVTSLASKVIVLDGGKKIAEGTPAEVRTNERVVSAYLGRSQAK